MLGRTISHFKIVSQLGAGGMGVVFRAEDLRLGRPVALKFLPDELAHDPRAVERLRSEARAASALNHPNICTIYTIDEHDGRPFIAMELMKGQTLRDRLSAGPLRIHQVVDIGIQIADALDAAHAQNIIHRDIKPANIFLTDRNQVKVLDFGLAKETPELAGSSTTRAAELTEAGVTLGTVSHMSPEQATGEELDGRSDLFSLGVVLYECATGHQPFKGKTSAVVLSAILNRPPVAPVVFNPDIPLRLQDVINNSLEKDRELRYQSAADLRADLKRVKRDLESGHAQTVAAAPAQSAAHASALPSGPHVDSSGIRQPAVFDSGPRQRRRPVALLAITAAVLAAMAGGTYLVLRPASPPRATAGSPTASATADAVPKLLALATASFEARNYRSALDYASQALEAAPGHAGATRLGDESRAMLERFDAAIADARRHADAGDVGQATQALLLARAIDPAAPAVAEIDRALSNPVETRPAPVTPPADARDRTAPEPSRAARPPAPSPAAASRATAPSPAAAAPEPQAAAPPAAPAPIEPPAASAPARAAAAPAPIEPVAPPARPAQPAATAAPPAAAVAPPAAPTREQDEAAVRRVVESYVRAIETENLTLFRTAKPNLSAEEERRLVEGFRAVSSQRIELTFLSVEPKGDDAAVRIRRRDTIQAGGRQQTIESQQTITLARVKDGWVIVEIR